MLPETETRPCDVPTHTVVTFLLLAFGFTWGIFAAYLVYGQHLTPLFGAVSGGNPLFILAVYSPAIAAVLLTARHAGGAGLRRYFSRLLLWRCPPAWGLFLVLGIPAVPFTAALGAGVLDTAAFDYPPLPALMGALLFMLVLGPVEELGWRGYALPLLQRRLAPIWAGLLLGVVWAVWHLPAFVLSGTPQSGWGFMPFFVGTVAASVILTPLFNASGGSILLAALFHFQLNNPLWPDAQPYDMYLYGLVAIAVVWLNRGSLFRRESGISQVAPPP